MNFFSSSLASCSVRSRPERIVLPRSPHHLRGLWDSSTGSSRFSGRDEYIRIRKPNHQPFLMC
jgi:hypothetical protein